MRDTRGVLAGLAIAALSVFGSEVVGQESIPGGWASQVRVQSFDAPGLGGLGFGTFVPYLNGQTLQSSTAFATNVSDDFMTTSLFNGRSRVFNNLVPFADMLKKSGRKRSRR